MSDLPDTTTNMPQVNLPRRSALYIALRTAAILLAFTLVFTALMASLLPARRATKVSPTIALRAQ